MLCSSGSIFHIVFDEVLCGMPDCMSFAVLSAAELVETISGKYCRDVFHDIFCHCIFSSVQNRTKIYLKWRMEKAAAGYWRDSGVFFLFLAGSGGGVNPLHYFVTFSGGGRYTI
jgi:hypothetical protein